jgi:cysteinyl-tRNA synthetase
VAEVIEMSKNLSKADSDNLKGKYKSELIYSANLMGILQGSPDDWLRIGKTNDSDDSVKIEELIKERNNARSSKDFQRADEIRSELNDMGIEIEDTADGTIWRSK